MKLINADELRKSLFVYAPVSAQNVIGFCVNHAPTIEVTYCKDCKHRSEFKGEKDDFSTMSNMWQIYDTKYERN